MRRMRLNRRRAALAIILSGTALAPAGLGGCAAPNKEPNAPAAEAPAQATSAERDDAPPAEPSAQMGAASAPQDEEADPAAALARAERDLEASLGAEWAFARPPERKLEVAPHKEASGADGDVCGTACRALASMQRSADRLCALTTEDGTPARCDDARARVLRAEGRVAERCARCEG